MDKSVLEALRHLTDALSQAADCDDTTVLNAYSIMEQEITAAASHCAQKLYWRRKATAEKQQSKEDTRYEMD